MTKRTKPSVVSPPTASTAQEHAAEDEVNAHSVVEEALASAAHLLSTPEVEVLRESLLDHLFNTPVGRIQLERLRSRAVPAASGDQPRGTPDSDSHASAQAPSTAKRRTGR